MGEGHAGDELVRRAAVVDDRAVRGLGEQVGTLTLAELALRSEIYHEHPALIGIGQVFGGPQAEQMRSVLPPREPARLPSTLQA